MSCSMRTLPQHKVLGIFIFLKITRFATCSFSAFGHIILLPTKVSMRCTCSMSIIHIHKYLICIKSGHHLRKDVEIAPTHWPYPHSNMDAAIHFFKKIKYISCHPEYSPHLMRETIMTLYALRFSPEGDCFTLNSLQH